MQLPHPIPKPGLFFAFCTLIFIAVLKVPAAAANQLTFNPAGLRFGGVAVGQTETLAATITNNGSASVTLSTVSVNTAGYTVNQLALPLTLAPGQAANFTVTFSPAATGLDSGNIAFNGNAAYLNLRGQGVSGNSLTANPPSVAFGNVPTGSSGTALVTLTNSKNGSITIAQQLTTGAGFAVNGLALPLTLAAGHSYTFSLVFSPSSTGPISGMFQGLGSGNNVVLAVPLTGTGTAPGQLAISPATINFGNVTVGTSSSQTGTLSTTGASVIVSSVTSNSSGFVFGGLSLPATIAPGQNASYSVTFTPQASGTASATLSFTSNASNSPTTESLTGTGQYSVSLSWDPSTSQVAGYNVYRGTTSGGPYSKINSIPDPRTTYTDGTVASGQTYYYVTTAVNSSGQESTYSNQVAAVIPPP
jgi:hypothetical protein